MTKSSIITALAARADALGLSQAEWADLAGMKYQQLQRYLSGKVDPRLKTSERLAGAVGVRIEIVDINPADLDDF
jgi:transcriptional regulator with XRE-family HTH domain